MFEGVLRRRITTAFDVIALLRLEAEGRVEGKGQFVLGVYSNFGSIRLRVTFRET